MLSRNLRVLFLVLQLICISRCRVLRITTGQAQFFIEATALNASGFPTDLHGIGFDFIDWISRKLHLNPAIVKFYPTTEALLGSTSTFFYVNGTWKGAIGDLENNKSDIILTAVAAKSSFISHALVTFPYIESSYSIFIPYPENESNTWAVIKPFNVSVWIFLIVSLAVISLTMWILVTIKHPNQIKYGTILLYFVTVITGQGGSWHTKAQHCITLGVAWCLASVVLVNAYNGLLTSHMTITKPSPIATSLEDLVSKPGVNFYVNNNTYIHAILMQATTGIEKKLGDILHCQPDRVTTTVAECLDKTQRGPNACIMVTEVGMTYVRNTYRTSGKCQVTRAGRSVTSYNPVLLVRKNYPMAEDINEGVTHLRSLGLETGWSRRHRKSGEACPLKQTESARLEKLKLRHVSGAFVVLFFGLCSAFVCLAIEHLVHYFTVQRAYFKNPQKP